MPEKYDFSGWATRANLKCSDGRVIMPDAFKENNGQKVPLVWNHEHNEPANVLGHALLENKSEGVYAYCSFNDTESGVIGKALVQHGDILSLSIYANQLRQNGPNVVHGVIREVSLVHAPANPGAFIDNVIVHSDSDEAEAIIYNGEALELYHADDKQKKEEEEPAPKEEKKEPEEEKSGETLKDIIDTMNEKQKKVLYALVGMADKGRTKDAEEEEDEEEDKKEMKHNVFEDKDGQGSTEVLTHSEMTAIISDAKRFGSLKESVIEHGIENIDYLFPEAQNVTNTPQFIKRDTGWVAKVMSAVGHSPFSRIKSTFADITEDDARAKGYIKGNMKKEEFFSLLKRTTTPTTIYKKQKLDRDDVIDITDFDVVSWIKAEMRGMLDEEIARAILVGDGRLASSDDHINTDNIRPIIYDDSLFTINKQVTVAANATDEAKVKAFIRAAIKARKDYKGSGNPVLYTTEDILTDCLLIEDTTGRTIYETAETLAKKLRVKEIVTAPVLENLTGKNGGAFIGVIVNLNDYKVGADKGGAVNMFDDFDIDYNAMKYLIETRCSGALTVPYSAIALEFNTSN